MSLEQEFDPLVASNEEWRQRAKKTAARVAELERQLAESSATVGGLVSGVAVLRTEAKDLVNALDASDGTDISQSDAASAFAFLRRLAGEAR